jgi:hypothetical protein
MRDQPRDAHKDRECQGKPCEYAGAVFHNKQSYE